MLRAKKDLDELLRQATKYVDEYSGLNTADDGLVAMEHHADVNDDVNAGRTDRILENRNQKGALIISTVVVVTALMFLLNMALSPKQKPEAVAEAAGFAQPSPDSWSNKGDF